MIKNLIFDFGKVLVDYDFEAFIERLFDQPEERASFARLVTEPALMDRCDKEDTPFEEIISELQDEYPHYREALQYFHDHYTDIVTGEMPGMKEVLRSLKQQGYKLYGLTNWCSRVYGVMERYDIFALLDDRIISSEEHLIKPDAAIYLRLCEKLDIKPDECIFTDDKAVNIEGAQQVGINGIVFHDAQQYRDELASRFGITC